MIMASAAAVPGMPPEPQTAKLVNLTGHPVRIYGGSGRVTTIPASGVFIRVEEEPRVALRIRGGGDLISIVESTFGDVHGLPEQVPGVLYIVSRLVASMAPDRQDLVFPDRAVKNKGMNGSTVLAGCRAFARIPQSSPV